MGWPKLAELLQKRLRGPAAFGVRIDYHPGGAGSVTTTPDGEVLRGIYKAPHTELAVEREVAVSIDQPQLDIRAADLAADPVKADQLTLLEGPDAGTRYRFTDRHEDGYGFWRVFLQEIPA